MAAITRASIKARPGGKRKSFLGLVTTFLFLIALFNFFMNDSGLSLDDVEKSLGVNTNGDSVAASNSVVTTNSANSNTAASANADIKDPFYPKEVTTRQLSYLFHHTPNDRQGKEGHVILDMLLGHAYTFHQRRIYGGSCG